MLISDIKRFKQVFGLSEREAPYGGPLLTYHGFIIAEYYRAWSDDHFIYFGRSDLVLARERPRLRTESIDEAMQFMACRILPGMPRMRPEYIASRCAKLALTTPYAREFAEIGKKVLNADRKPMWHLDIRNDDSHAAAFRMLGMRLDYPTARLLFNIEGPNSR